MVSIIDKRRKEMMKQYKFGFDIWGLVIFFIIMLPNFVWFAIPAPNDVLRADSVTGTVDMVASVCQVLIVACLCALINQQSKKIRLSPLIIAAIVSCLLYFAGWVLYYSGVENAIVILILCVFPCLAFLFFAIDRKNMIAVIPISIFTICHLIYGMVNFII